MTTGSDRDGERRWVPWARGLFGVAVLGFVLSRLEWARLRDALVDPRWELVALAVALLFLINVLRGQRWSDILAANGIHRSSLELCALVFVGQFFNTFLPTAIGGDVARGYYVSRERSELTTSYVTVLVERGLGFLALAILAASAAGVALRAGTGEAPGTLLWTVLSVSVAVTVVGVLVFAWPPWTELLARLADWSGRDRLVHAAEELTEAVRLFHRPSTQRLRIVIVSFVIQFGAILFYAVTARALGVEVPMLAYFLVVPISVVAAMLPVTINGLGVREGVLVGLLVAHGGDAGRAGAFALAALFLTTIFSLIGAAIYPALPTRSDE